MRRDLFYHLQTLSFRFFDNRQTGELMSRMINDIGRVTDAVNHAPEDIGGKWRIHRRGSPLSAYGFEHAQEVGPADLLQSPS